MGTSARAAVGTNAKSCGAGKLAPRELQRIGAGQESRRESRDYFPQILDTAVFAQLSVTASSGRAMYGDLSFGSRDRAASGM